MKFWMSMAFMQELDHLAPVAKAVEAAGYHGVTLSDHLFFPGELASKYPYSETGAPLWDPATPWPDVWCTISALAAVTTTLHFSQAIFIAPARNVYVLAKQIGTAAALSGNRVALGAGIGWMREEFEATGQDFTNRGSRFTEMITVLRTILTGDMIEHHGRYYDVPKIQMQPAPSRPVPIYCGGDSDAAKQRAVEHCDGWMAVGDRPLDVIIGHVRDVRKRLEAVGRDPAGFEIIARTGRDQPNAENYTRLADEGVTSTSCAPWVNSAVAPGSFAGPLQGKLDEINRFADDVMRKVP